jgi:hypothetical protein
VKAPRRKIDNTHYYFGDPKSLRSTLAQQNKERPPFDRPYGQFTSGYAADAERLNGFVWTDDWVVGVWAVIESDRIVDAVFWTILNGADATVEEVDGVNWSRSELVEQAAIWLAHHPEA